MTQTPDFQVNPFGREQPPRGFVDIVHMTEFLELNLVNDWTGDDLLKLSIKVELRWNADANALEFEPAEYTLGEHTHEVQARPGPFDGPIRSNVIHDICKQHYTVERLSKLIDEEDAFAFVRAAYARNKASARSLYQRERI